MPAIPLDWIPRIDYDDCEVPESLILSLPQAHWDVISLGVGGSDISAARVQESFQIRRDRLRRVRVRIYEEEWPAFEHMLHIVQRQGSGITYWFDRDVSATAFDCLLIAPHMGEEAVPFRDEGDPNVLVFEMLIATSQGEEFALPYHGDATFLSGSVVLEGA